MKTKLRKYLSGSACNSQWLSDMIKQFSCVVDSHDAMIIRSQTRFDWWEASASIIQFYDNQEI